MARSHQHLLKQVEVSAKGGSAPGGKDKVKVEAEICQFPSILKPESAEKTFDVGRAIMVLREGSERERADTAKLMGDLAFMRKMKIPEAVMPLSVLLKIDEDPLVREEAAWALWKLGEKRASEALLHALANDTHTVVREKAARALGLLGVNEAVPLMVALLSLGRSIPARLRAALAASLGLLVDMQAARVLLSAALDSEPPVRYEAVKSLGRYLLNFPPEISEKSFSQIIHSLNPRRERIAKIRQAAIKALRMCNTPKALEVIAKAAVSDPDAETRKLAVETLLCFEGAVAEDALIKALEDSNWGVRKMAARVLSESVKRSRVYNTPRVCEALARMERMFPSGSREWRLAAEAFASL